MLLLRGPNSISLDKASLSLFAPSPADSKFSLNVLATASMLITFSATPRIEPENSRLDFSNFSLNSDCMLAISREFCLLILDALDMAPYCCNKLLLDVKILFSVSFLDFNKLN